MTAISSTPSKPSTATQTATGTTPTSTPAAAPSTTPAPPPPVRATSPDVIQNLAAQFKSSPFGKSLAKGLATMQAKAQEFEQRKQEILDKYSVGSKSSSGQLCETVEKGEKVSPEAEAAKWKELEAKGFDRASFDGKAYLEQNPDVAKAWKTDEGRIDPELAAATHYQEWGRHEGREFTAKTSTAQLHERVQSGEKIGPEAEAAKWKELEAQGLDRAKFDGEAYLKQNPDVAKAWKTDSGLIDPELAAATHYQETGRLEGRAFTAKQTTATKLGGAKGSQPVEFNKMTQEQQYNYLQDLQVARAGGDETAWKTGDRELNLVGVRSFTDGKANKGEADKFNDTVYACRIVDGEKQVQAFKATVDAGKWKDADKKGYDVKGRDGKSYGTANLADGFFRDAWARGSVSGDDMGLRQVGWVRVHGDRNTDGIVDKAEKVGPGGKGALGGADLQMQFHSAGGSRVGEGSAGCQAIHASQWAQFQDLLREAPDSQKTFSYTLVDGQQLRARSDEGKGGGALFRTAAYDPVNLKNELNAVGVTQVYHFEVNARGRGVPLSAGDEGRVDAVNSDSGDGIGIVRTPIKK